MGILDSLFGIPRQKSGTTLNSNNIITSEYLNKQKIENKYVRAIIMSSTDFLEAAGKSKPTLEELFNSILLFTVILGVYQIRFKIPFKYDSVEVLTEVGKLFADSMINISLVSHHEIERQSIQSSLDAKIRTSSHYSGDLLATGLYILRFNEFFDGALHSDIQSFPSFARDYALLSMNAYTQGPVQLMDCANKVQLFLILISM